MSSFPGKPSSSTGLIMLLKIPDFYVYKSRILCYNKLNAAVRQTP